MPLPFAPKPDESKVYQSLKDKLVSEVTADQFDSLKGSVYAQGTDGAEDEYRRLLLLGLASDQVSVAGPIPGSLQVIQIDYDEAATKTVFSPGSGEVWLYVGSSRTSATITTGSITYRILINDDVNSTQLCIISEASSSTGQAPLWDGADQIPVPIYIDDNSTFKLKTSGSFSALQTEHGFVRVR